MEELQAIYQRGDLSVQSIDLSNRDIHDLGPIIQFLTKFKSIKSVFHSAAQYILQFNHENHSEHIAAYHPRRNRY